MRRAAAMLLLLLGSCAAAAPPPREPELPPSMPGDWTAAHGPGELDISAEWWRDFGDDRLTSLVDQALVRNPSLREAAARLDAALAAATAAGADLYPHLFASADAGNGRRFTGKTPLAAPTLRRESYGVGLNVSWEIDLWGRIRAGREASLADAQAQQALLEGAALSLAAQTTKAYFVAIEGARQVEVALANLESAEDLAARIRQRFRDGLRSALDVKLAESEVASSRSTLELRRRLADAAVRQLELLAGRYPAGAATVGDALPPLPEPVPVGVPADVIARRPDLAAAERRLAASGARVAEARASLYPRISIVGSKGLASSDFDDLLDGDFKVWTLVANLTAPLFEGGRLRANVAAREAQEEAAVAAFANDVLGAFGEVEIALAAEHHLAAEEAALRRLVSDARQSVELSEERYLAGLVDVLAVLEARGRHFAAQSLHLDVLRQRLARRVDLYVALGGGFEGNDR